MPILDEYIEQIKTGKANEIVKKLEAISAIQNTPDFNKLKAQWKNYEMSLYLNIHSPELVIRFQIEEFTDFFEKLNLEEKLVKYLRDKKNSDAKKAELNLLKSGKNRETSYKSGILPEKFDEINDNIYAGFWIRLVANLLDFLIILPVVILIWYINGYGFTASYITTIGSLIFSILYNVFLVEKFGGTPGKLLTGIKIINIKGNDIDLRGSILRFIVSIFLIIFQSVVFIIILQNLDEDLYKSLGFIEKSRYLSEFNPLLFKISNYINNIWVYSEFIVLLTNKRKRAIHDFMADTVVIKAKYHDKIKEIMKVY